MTVITTAEAATTAGVTAATVRTWCRRNVIGAVKAGGRWAIDAASLAHRIALGALRTKPAAPKPVVYSVETMTAIGGNEWTRGDKHRVYINDWTAYAGLEVDHYKTGNISSASIDGRGIANSRVGGLLGAVRSVYFDAADGRLHVAHRDGDAFEVRYLDGERDTIDLVARIFTGVHAAIAAL